MNKKILLVSVIFFLLGLFFGYLIVDFFYQQKEQGDINFNSQIRQGGFNFINPLLECDASEELTIKESQKLKLNISNKIKNSIDNASVTQISYYFRDLNNGAWFGIDEKENFSPASLLKVPLMIAYFKLSEKDPNILNKKILFNLPGDENLIENIKPKKVIEKNKEYTIKELIEYMIIYSDNNAKTLLFLNISENDLSRIYTDLGIEIPGIRNVDDFMSVKDYASFFRVLYNASYLNREMSEKALDLLSKTDFEDGIVKNLPRNIKVSQKFGERRIDDISQLHDCGIVYKSKNPYLICVMTRGRSIDDLKKVIQNLSFETYTSIEKNN